MSEHNQPLTLVQIAALLQAIPQTLRSELTALPAEAHRRRPAPGEWCINEVVGHMIVADRNGFDGRIRTILAEDQPHLPAWAIAETAAQRQDCERDLFELLAELAAMREQSAQLVTNLQPDQLTRTGIHSLVGELMVGDLLYEWLYHDRNHFKQILSNVQAYLWPSMGSAQKFSELGNTP